MSAPNPKPSTSAKTLLGAPSAAPLPRKTLVGAPPAAPAPAKTKVAFPAAAPPPPKTDLAPPPARASEPPVTALVVQPAAPPPLWPVSRSGEATIALAAPRNRRALIAGAAAAVALVALAAWALRAQKAAPPAPRRENATPVAPPAPPVVVALDPAATAPGPVEPAAPREAAPREAAPEETAAPRPHRRERPAARAKHQRAHAARRKKATATAADHDAARAAYARGNSLLLTGNAGGAIAAYQEAVHLAPTEPGGYRGLGLAYEKEGKVDDAIAALVSYLKLSRHARDREVIARRLYRLTHPNRGAR